MVRFCETALYVMWIMIIHITFPMNVIAQSKHAMCWYVNGYEFDFSQSPVLIVSHEEDAEWYVDSNGIHVLTYSSGKIYDESFNAIVENCTAGFFVPSPCNKNMVFYFEPRKYTIIDLKTKSAKLCGEGPYFSPTDNIVVVHHSQCDKMWILVEQNGFIAKYILTSECIEKVDDVPLQQVYPPGFPKFYVSLSRDCQHYVAPYFIDSENKSGVSYGSFDRTTGDFEMVANHFFEDDDVIQGAIIAPDNSRIYCVFVSKNGGPRSFKIVEVPIENSIPQYDKKKDVVEKKPNGFAFCFMYYAIDGNIYVFENSTRLCSALSINANGETEYEDIYNFGHIAANLVPRRFVSSWFMDNQCPETDAEHNCENIPVPEIDFENSYVCYGETLNVVLHSKNKCSIEYIDDNGLVHKVDDILDTFFPLTNTPGVYKITKIFFDGCVFVLSTPPVGEVGAKINAPIIRPR